MCGHVYRTRLLACGLGIRGSFLNGAIDPGARLPARAGRRVTAPPPDLFRRECRRPLAERSAKSIERGFDVGHVREWTTPRFADRPTLGITRISPDAELQNGAVAFVGAADEPREPRCASEDQRQHSGRRRVERSGVADAALAERTPDPGNDVVRGRAGGFIDN
jgi:hypothetical protein